MITLNSIDNGQIFVLDNEINCFKPKEFHEVKKEDIIMLSHGNYIVKNAPHFSLDLPEGTLELEIKKRK